MLVRALTAIALSVGLGACVQPVAVPVYSGAPVAAACDSRFSVVNVSGLTVRELYFSHASQRNWGADQLGSNMIAPGQAVNYRAANAGLYDFRVVWVNGNSAELRNVDVCSYARINVGRGGLSAS